MNSANNRLLLVLNPVAGKGYGKKKLFEAVDTLTNHGYRVTVLPTSPGNITTDTIANEAKNYDIAVAIGGDGTLNAAANGIVRSGTGIPMGYIPLGSTNDFATSLGLSSDIKKACEFIATNEAKTIDMGRFGDRYFVYIACTGLFASASYTTSQKLKNRLGYSAYLMSGLSDLVKAKTTKYTIELENETIEEELLVMSVSNTLKAGGVFKIPKDEVVFNDGVFELSMLKAPKSFINSPVWAKNVLASDFEKECFDLKKTKKAIIRVDSPQGWSLDGENGGEHKEAVIEVCEKALRFIY